MTENLKSVKKCFVCRKIVKDITEFKLFHYLTEYIDQDIDEFIINEYNLVHIIASKEHFVDDLVNVCLKCFELTLKLFVNSLLDDTIESLLNLYFDI